jgi:hypothetical protein
MCRCVRSVTLSILIIEVKNATELYIGDESAKVQCSCYKPVYRKVLAEPRIQSMRLQSQSDTKFFLPTVWVLSSKG